MKKKQVLTSFALCALVLAGCSTGGGDKAKTESGDKAAKQEIFGKNCCGRQKLVLR